MGLPITLVAGTNVNDIFHRALSLGDFSLTDVIPTVAPAMDIQVLICFHFHLRYIIPTHISLLLRAPVGNTFCKISPFNIGKSKGSNPLFSSLTIFSLLS